MNYVPRAAWGARAPRFRDQIATPTPRLWIHHTADEHHGPAGVRATQAFHMDSRGWSDIAYSFLVDDDGTVYEGRGYGIAGAHTEGDNHTSHAICLMGNFENRPPTAAALAATRELVAAGVARRAWTGLTGGHRDAPGAQTACPGRYLYAHLPTLTAPPGEEPDMPLTDDDAFVIGVTVKRALADLGITDELPKKVDAIDRRTSRTRRVLWSVAAKVGLTPAQITDAADG